MMASDVASLHEFSDVCEVIQLVSPSIAAASQDVNYQVYRTVV